MAAGDNVRSPNPEAVHDLESLTRELDLLRVRAARGTGGNRISIDAIVRALGMNRTQRSTVGNYLAGKTLAPLDVLERIVSALGATTEEQVQWHEAWYQVYDDIRARRNGRVPEVEVPPETSSQVRIDQDADGDPQLHLSPPPARTTRASVEDHTLDAAEALDAWLADETSNLAIVMGDFGSGKTTVLEDFVERNGVGRHRPHYTRYADIRVDDLTVSRPEGANHILVIDDFDAFNPLGGRQVPPPDLRELLGILSQVDKIVIATRRTSRHRRDELIRQLIRPQRYDRFQVRRPTQIELQPYPHEILVQIGRAMQNPAFQDFFQLLAPGGRLASRQLRNPLFLNSMVKESARLQAGEAWSIDHIYDEYIHNVLTEDWDRRRSRIRESRKVTVLARIADRVFIEREAQVDPVLAPRGIPDDQVTELVDAVCRPPAASQDSDSRGYDWTSDFLATTHLVLELPPEELRLALEPEYGFSHRSFYDHFLARAIVSKVRRGEPSGLNRDSLRPELFESLTPYFMRALLGGKLGASMGAMARRQDLGPTDRLLLLHLLEDDAKFAELLDSAPTEYVGQLKVWLEQVESLYLRKVIMYQLVVLGRSSALKYVELARADEGHYDVTRENLTLSGEVSVTAFQIQRLMNATLASALPITVYRLGQLGDDTAVEPLRRLDTTDDPDLAALVEEAIGRISSRSEQDEHAPATRA